MQAMRGNQGNLTSGPTLSTCQQLSNTVKITYDVRAQGGKNVEMETGYGNLGVRGQKPRRGTPYKKDRGAHWKL